MLMSLEKLSLEFINVYSAKSFNYVMFVIQKEKLERIPRLLRLLTKLLKKKFRKNLKKGYRKYNNRSKNYIKGRERTH